MSNHDRTRAKARAFEDALGRIGERISEVDARDLAVFEDCACKEGMFALAATRRQIFAGAAVAGAAGMTTLLPRESQAKAPAGAIEYPVQADPTKEQGRIM